MAESASKVTEPVEALLLRLRQGQTLLTRQHARWLADDAKAAKAEVFSDALARWDALERVFRCTGYTGCIWGPGKSCPEESVIRCDGCVGGVQSQPRLL